MDFIESEKVRRKALKAERDLLFTQYLAQPKNTRLAIEIKAIDDEIAKSIEESISPRRPRKFIAASPKAERFVK